MSHFITILLLVAFCSGSLQAQLDLSTVVKKYQDYQAIWPKTYVHLTLNQTKFYAGDSVFFKAHLLKEDLTPVPGNQLIKVNLVNAEGRSMAEQLFIAINGVGGSGLAIPPNLVVGSYSIIAHTTWMKNFSADLFFKKQIQVVKDKQLTHGIVPQLKVRVEGGNLIAGDSCIVSVQIHKPGETVEIIDGDGIIVGQIETDQNGLGSMTLVPGQNTNYFARVRNSALQANLPHVQLDGYSIRTKPIESSATNVSVRLPEGASRTEDVMLVVTSAGKILFSKQLYPNEITGKHFSINIDNLSPGINHATIISKNGLVLSQRPFFTDQKQLASVSFSNLSPTINPRKLVRFEVNVTSPGGQPVSGEFSIAIVNNSVVATTPPRLIHEDIFLSGLHTEILPPAKRAKVIDEFVLVNANPINWTAILANTINQPKHPYTSVIEKRGKVYFAGTQQIVPDLTQLTFYFQKSKKRIQTFTERGEVSFTIPDIESDDELFYLAHSRGTEIPNVRVEWIQDESIFANTPNEIVSGKDDAYGAFSRQQSIIANSYGAFLVNTTKKTTDEAGWKSFEKEIASADITIDLEDYIVFPNMQELLKEVLPSIFYRKTEAKTMVRIKLPEPMNALEDPIYVIDGFVTKNTNYFLSLNPADLKTIKLINTPKKLWGLGQLGKNGIVIVQTYSGDKRDPLDDSSKLIKAPAKPLLTNAVNRAVSSPNMPIFKSTVYWNASVKTDAAGIASIEFYSTDDLGSLQITVTGLSATGHCFGANKFIEATLNR